MKVSFFTLIQGSYLAVLACKQEQIALKSGILIGLEKKNKFFRPNVYILLKNIFYPR